MSVIENYLTQITRAFVSMMENSCEFSEIPETTGKSSYLVVENGEGGGVWHPVSENTTIYQCWRSSAQIYPDISILLK